MDALTLSRDAAWQLLTECTRGDSLLKHALGGRSRGPRLRAPVRRAGRRMGRRRPAARLRLRAVSDARAIIRSAAARILRRWAIPDWVTRAILSHADYSGVPRETPAREDAVRLRRDGRLRHRGVAGAAVQERARPRGDSVIKRMKDKAFARGVQARRPAPRRRAARAAARGARRQRHRVHAGAGRCARTAGNAVRREPDTCADAPISVRSF